MFCPHCGREFAPTANFCSTCGAQALPLPSAGSQTRIVRPRSPRMIAGVCSGIAIHYGWDVSLVRILCAVLALCTSGIGLVFYLAAWIFLPDAPYALPPAPAAGTVPPPPPPAAGTFTSTPYHSGPAV